MGFALVNVVNINASLTANTSCHNKFLPNQYNQRERSVANVRLRLFQVSFSQTPTVA
jgi:hypothetical protein